jgi:predicted glycoside hydrolase/deacetylase ChbG (UPF0249 family)
MDLIVNADDLGISRNVNRATFELLDQRLVTSATLLANGEFVEEACSELFRFPHCSFGVNLNITEFRSLSGSGLLDPLLDNSGMFQQSRTRQVSLDRPLLEGIFEEFSAQIQKLASLGVQVSHIDSHHYILSMPRLFPILKRIQKKFRIRRARITRNIYADELISQLGLTPHELAVDPLLADGDVSKSLRAKKWLYNFFLRNYYRTKTTDGFSGFRLFYEYAKTHKMNQRTFEVNVHPENPFYDAGEAEILRGPWREAIGFPIRLISYYEI